VNQKRIMKAAESITVDSCAFGGADGPSVLVGWNGSALDRNFKGVVTIFPDRTENTRITAPIEPMKTRRNLSPKHSPIGWSAVANLMPSQPSLNVHGIVWVPTTGDTANLLRDGRGVEVPEVVTLKCEISPKPVPAGRLCLEVMTPVAVSWRLAGYAGGKKSVVISMPAGETVSLPVTEVH
jgi:hypothetical protein